MSIDYSRYIGSHAWRTSPARLAELEAARFRCRICEAGSPEAAIEVHHRTYARLGQEDVADLTTLCRDCHRVVTDALRRRRYLARPSGAAAAADLRPPLLGRRLQDSWREDRT